MAVPQFSDRDRALLDGIANIHQAVGESSIRRACEQFRDALLHERGRLAIGAEALRSFLQARGNNVCIDVHATKWINFFYLAEDIDGTEEQENSDRSRGGDPARAASFRRLRVTARLTALWGMEVLEHYGFTSWNLKKLESLAKCADALPDFHDFAHIANCVLLQRHESSLTSNRADRIGQHTVANQHYSITTAPRSDQPLQNKDIHHVLGFMLGKTPIFLAERRFESHEDLSQNRSRMDDWVQDEIGDIIVGVTALKDYRRFRSTDYRLQYDLYGLLIPREHGKSLKQQITRQGKRQREAHTAAVQVGCSTHMAVPRLAAQKRRSPLRPYPPSLSCAKDSRSRSGPNETSCMTTRSDSSLSIDRDRPTEADNNESNSCFTPGPFLTESGPHVCSNVCEPVETPTCLVPASLIGSEALSPTHDRDEPVTTEFDAHFVCYPDDFAAIDEADETSPIGRSLALTDSQTHTISDLATPSMRLPSVSGSPCSFSSFLTMPSSTFLSIGASSCSEPAEPECSHVGLTECIPPIEPYNIRDALAEAWLQLPELKRRERLEPFTYPANHDKFYIATPAQIQAAVHSGFKFSKPIVTNCTFLDSEIHTPEAFADNLVRFYPKDGYQAHFHDSPMLPIAMRQLAEMMKAPLRKGYGILNVGSRNKSHMAPFLLNHRFSLLDTLLERIEQDPEVQKGAKSGISAENLSLHASMLGFPGVFLRPHLDNMVGSQMRVLFGEQRLAVVPYDELTKEQRADFMSAGRQWCPPPGKGQMIRLGSDDVVLIPPGLKIIRAAFIDELSLFEYGCLWDFFAVKDIFLGLLHVLEHPKCISEPGLNFPTRLIEELRDWVCSETELFTDGDDEQLRADLQVIWDKMRSTSCACTSCRPGNCICERSRRQCTEWCRNHIAGRDCTL